MVGMDADADAPRGRGRPSRAEVSAKALAGIDPGNVDPLDVLRSICADESAPASARVSAAKELRRAEREEEVRAWNKRAGIF